MWGFPRPTWVVASLLLESWVVINVGGWPGIDESASGICLFELGFRDDWIVGYCCGRFGWRLKVVVVGGRLPFLVLSGMIYDGFIR